MSLPLFPCSSSLMNSGESRGRVSKNQVSKLLIAVTLFGWNLSRLIRSSTRRSSTVFDAYDCFDEDEDDDMSLALYSFRGSNALTETTRTGRAKRA